MLTSTDAQQFNITAMLRAGRDADRIAYRDLEGGKIGTLRAGNSGIRADTGDVAGMCHRKTHLRSLGLEVDPPTDDKLIMFQLGYANEDVLLADLLKTLPADHIIRREEEIPISWTTSTGVVVTGRPDLVICRQEPFEEIKVRTIPVLGLELKSVHSVWVARDVVFSGKPKLGNIIQAAHYAWKLGIPYKIVYKSYSSLGQGMSWAARMASMFPAEGEPGSEFMNYNKNSQPLQVKQFEVVYDLEIDSTGRVNYRLEGTEEWHPSLVTTQDIERYFEYVSTMGTKRDLGPRPQTLDAHGEKLNYTDCAYCPLQATCDTHEAAGYEKWLSEVRVQLNSNTNNNRI